MSLLYLHRTRLHHIMAGAIRQQIDIPALERYIDQHVPIIKTPLEVKQVCHQQGLVSQIEEG